MHISFIHEGIHKSREEVQGEGIPSSNLLLLARGNLYKAVHHVRTITPESLQRPTPQNYATDFRIIPNRGRSLIWFQMCSS
jgi:hypothetical protein